MPRLGSAIASTILSLFSAVSLVGVDKAQAAVLTYNFKWNGAGSGFFKVDNSSLTGIGALNKLPFPREDSTVSLLALFLLGGKEYYDLAGATALFYQGDFRGLQASGSDYGDERINHSSRRTRRAFVLKVESRHLGLSLPTGRGPTVPVDICVNGYYEQYTTYNGGSLTARPIEDYLQRCPVSYTLVNTEAEPVPEPLTAGGTALALAGLSWLKHKKKMAA
jgi:hypothetical protein